MRLVFRKWLFDGCFYEWSDIVKGRMECNYCRVLN